MSLGLELLKTVHFSSSTDGNALFEFDQSYCGLGVNYGLAGFI